MASTGPPASSLKRTSSTSSEGDELIITPLGAGNEVGRSCVYMSYKGKTVLVHFSCHISVSFMHLWDGWILELLTGCNHFPPFFCSLLV